MTTDHLRQRQTPKKVTDMKYMPDNGHGQFNCHHHHKP